MDKTVALKNDCKDFNFFEQEHRYLPGNYETDFPEEDSTSSAVTMYFRTIGLHALLSRQDEVNIANDSATGPFSGNDSQTQAHPTKHISEAKQVG